MTSLPSPAYPAEYYYPEFIESRSDDPRISPPSRPILITLVTTPREPIEKKESKNLANNIATDHGLPDVDITQSVKTDPNKSLIRDPVERNIPRLIVDDNILNTATHSLTVYQTNVDNENTISNENTNQDLLNKSKIKHTESIKQSQHVVKVTGDRQPMDGYWKKEVSGDYEEAVSMKPLKYDEYTYAGPFSLSRQGALAFYITISVLTLLAAIFLIMTGVFYGQSYPDSSSNTAKLAGIGVCAFVFYLGVQLILIAIWHQKYQQENASRIIIKSAIGNDPSDYVKPSKEDHQQYNNNSYQEQIDYTPYTHFSNPPYVSNANQEMLLQQPGAATGANVYEPVVWPSNVEIETQPDAKFFQPMDWSDGVQAKQSLTDLPPSTARHSSMSNLMHDKMKKKTKSMPTKTVQAQLPKVEFDNIHLDSHVNEQPPLPVLAKAPETSDLIKSIAAMEQNIQQSSADGDLSRRKSSRRRHTDIKTEVSFFDDDEDHHHHHHRDHDHQHRHRRYHHRHRSNHHRHHDRDHHHHRRRHHSHSPCSQCSPHAHSDYHQDYAHSGHYHHHQQDSVYSGQYHHHSHSHPEVSSKILTPRLPRIITPTPKRIDTRIFRETGINTGSETKIMRDSSVTADLEDVPFIGDNRLEKIPVVRRTIIVEPYPAQPSSQILVKPRADMVGKIRLGKNTQISGNNETIIYPSSAFMMKIPTKKKKRTIVNNNIIEDLHLEDNNNDNDEGLRSRKSKTNMTSAKKTIKNAFYN